MTAIRETDLYAPVKAHLEAAGYEVKAEVGPADVMGVIGETVADRQLLAFKRDPAHRGRTCRAGLWRYSRHPNYFFEWVLWCGFGAFGLTGPLGWLGLAAPFLILFTILFETGIPPTEAQALASRGEDYRRYQRTTRAFVPWPPPPDDSPQAPREKGT